MNSVASSACVNSWDDTNKVVVPSQFKTCLENFLATAGARFNRDMVCNDNNGRRVECSSDASKIVGFRQYVTQIFISDAASEGVALLVDMKRICDEHGIDKTFTFAQKYFDYETYVVFEGEAILNVTLALVAVFCIMFLVTANIQVTLFILLCVGLVDFFLLSLLTLWGVTFNQVTVVNIVIAIGLAVDYSAHIGHSFLTIEPPEKDAETNEPLTNYQKRVYKARGALGAMGSSVFHGVLSTFLAIIVLSPSKSYIFKSFFRMWFGIIIYGSANGFILLPVLLSLCGPLNRVQHSTFVGDDEEKNELELVPDSEKKMIVQVA